MKIIKLTPVFIIVVAIALVSCSNVKISSKDEYKVIEFPDGSVAYLNKGSKIEFNKNFDERIVNQQGEVFYEVVKGNSPFIVKTPSGEIKVLGTKFNLKSTNDDIEVEVESGTVELKIDKLIKKVTKGQKAICKNIEKNIKTINAELKYQNWLKSAEFQQIKKEIIKSSKQIKKDSKKAGKEVKKDLKKLKKKLN